MADAVYEECASDFLVDPPQLCFEKLSRSMYRETESESADFSSDGRDGATRVREMVMEVRQRMLCHEAREHGRLGKISKLSPYGPKTGRALPGRKHQPGEISSWRRKQLKEMRSEEVGRRQQVDRGVPLGGRFGSDVFSGGRLSNRKSLDVMSQRSQRCYLALDECVRSARILSGQVSQPEARASSTGVLCGGTGWYRTRFVHRRLEITAGGSQQNLLSWSFRMQATISVIEISLVQNGLGPPILSRQPPHRAIRRSWLQFWRRSRF